MKDEFLLFLAQGFGVGRIPFAPGTFGSVVGLGWFALLLATGSVWLYALGTILGLAASVWLCGEGERILKQTDPGSVVMDEIVVLPICFVPWLFAHGSLSAPAFFFSGRNLWLTLGVLVLFRIFDIAKPWPVKQSQSLRGGWGVTVDDMLAAVYVCACVWIAHLAGVL